MSVNFIGFDSWRIKYQLDVTCYFISLLMCSTCFGHSYIHHQELATILLNYHIGRIVLGSMCVGDLVRLGLSSVRVTGCNTDTTQTQPHQISNTQRPENKTTDVVIQQQSRKLLMMDILMSETCWVHKKWNKITSDIKLVFYSSSLYNYALPVVGGNDSQRPCNANRFCLLCLQKPLMRSS